MSKFFDLEYLGNLTSEEQYTWLDGITDKQAENSDEEGDSDADDCDPVPIPRKSAKGKLIQTGCQTMYIF